MEKPTSPYAPLNKKCHLLLFCEGKRPEAFGKKEKAAFLFTKTGKPSQKANEILSNILKLKYHENKKLLFISHCRLHHKVGHNKKTITGGFQWSISRRSIWNNKMAFLNFDGKYSIKVKTGTILEYSFCGYKTVNQTLQTSY
jgi:hypothetical protein